MENNKTLWEKLKTENKEKVENHWREKPIVLQSIKDEMTCVNWYKDLSYSTIKNIYYPCYGLFEEIKEINLINLFN